MVWLDKLYFFKLRILKFTLYLNKVSLISINKKTIHKLLIKFNVTNIYKLLRIRNFLLTIIDNNSETKDENLNNFINNILEYYDINKKELLSIKKIYKSSI